MCVGNTVQSCLYETRDILGFLLACAGCPWMYGAQLCCYLVSVLGFSFGGVLVSFNHVHVFSRTCDSSGHGTCGIQVRHHSRRASYQNISQLLQDRGQRSPCYQDQWVWTNACMWNLVSWPSTRTIKWTMMFVLFPDTLEKIMANHIFWCPTGQFVVLAGLKRYVVNRFVCLWAEVLVCLALVGLKLSCQFNHSRLIFSPNLYPPSFLNEVYCVYGSSISKCWLSSTLITL